jgi:hypothetical protein
VSAADANEARLTAKASGAARLPASTPCSSLRRSATPTSCNVPPLSHAVPVRRYLPPSPTCNIEAPSLVVSSAAGCTYPRLSCRRTLRTRWRLLPKLLRAPDARGQFSAAVDRQLRDEEYSSQVQQRPHDLTRSASSICVLPAITGPETATLRSSGRRDSCACGPHDRSVQRPDEAGGPTPRYADQPSVSPQTASDVTKPYSPVLARPIAHVNHAHSWLFDLASVVEASASRRMAVLATSR